jgi:hypothetical protein
MKRSWLLSSIIIILVLVLAGCNSTAGPTQKAPTQVIPTPSKPGTATVTGYLYVNQASPRPVAEASLALAGVVPSTDGKPWLAGFDRVNDMRTSTDANGHFIFKDVPVEKTYALILDRFLNAYLLNTPNDNKDMLIVLKAGQVLDLGKLIYATMPGEPDDTPAPDK